MICDDVVPDGNEDDNETLADSLSLEPDSTDVEKDVIIDVGDIVEVPSEDDRGVVGVKEGLREDDRLDKGGFAART